MQHAAQGHTLLLTSTSLDIQQYEQQRSLSLDLFPKIDHA